jgi:LuxR family maltose regulon positive regulatory protein
MPRRAAEIGTEVVQRFRSSLVNEGGSTVPLDADLEGEADSALGTPPLAAGLVSRPRLVDRLRSAADAALLLVTAPAGYGKTTLLGEWAQGESRPFAWLSIRPVHDDPAFLLTCVVEALDRVEPVDSVVLEPLAGPLPDIDGIALPRLRAALEADRQDFVLVLDDLHWLTSDSAFAAIGALREALPGGAQLVLAARAEPHLPLGRLRAQRSLVELNQADLAMTHAETRDLLLGIGLDLNPAQVDALFERTEGWPAALYLAGLALLGGEDGIDTAIADFAGDDRFVVDYLRDEFIAGITKAELRFLTRSSILDRMSGSLCDAVLEQSDSGQELRMLSRSNMLLTPLDHRDEWFRYHALLREMLASELQRTERSAEPGLHQRASAWYAEHEDFDRAIDHAIAAGDADSAGELIWASFPYYASRGRVATIERWLERFDEASIASQAPLGLTAAEVSLTRGDGNAAGRWIAAATDAIEDGKSKPPATIEAGLLLARAAIGRDGVARMGTDAASAYEIYSEDDLWRSLCRLIEGTALCLGGDATTGRKLLEEAARRGAVAPNIQVLSNAQLALMTIDRDRQAASALVAQAKAQLDRYGLRDYPTMALPVAVVALFHARSGQTAEAAEEVAEALRLLARVRDFTPWFEVETRIVIARALLRLDDGPQARQLLGEASRRLRQVPDATLLAVWIQEGKALLGQASTEAGLTPAELRVLQFMPTHLSFREIAQHLYVSPNTVKTQAQAIYRKLGVTARAEAVDIARGAGLLDEGEPS